MGFPVDAPKQNPNISSEYDRYFWKISDSDFSVCGRVETEYIERLLETKNREKSFEAVLALLAEYGVTSDELTAALTSGCVFFFSPEEAQTMLDEFIFIIRSLLPRQLSDIYYSFDIEPNPAHSIFFDMAAKRLNLARYTDRNKNNYGQFISHTAEGVEERVRDGETLLSIYENTCATKEIIKSAYSSAISSKNFVAPRNKAIMRMEYALFGLSRKYKYSISALLTCGNEAFDFVIYEDGTPIIALDYLGEDYITPFGYPFVKTSSYDELLKLFSDKDKLCRANNVSYILLDIRELDGDMYVGSFIRDVIKTPALAKLHRQERSEYFAYGRARDDALGNWDAIQKANICGCFECCGIIPPSQITEYEEYEDAAVCPLCGATTIISDNQGYEITKEYLKKVNLYIQNEA